MRVAALTLSLLSLNCAGSRPSAEPPPSSTTARLAEAAVADLSPEVVVLGNRTAATLSVTFRSSAPVALSTEDGARLVTPRGTVTARLADPPVQSIENDTVIVTTGSYTVSGDDYLTANLSGRSSTIQLTIGGEPRTFAVVRGDVFE